MRIWIHNNYEDRANYIKEINLKDVSIEYANSEDFGIKKTVSLDEFLIVQMTRISNLENLLNKGEKK